MKESPPQPVLPYESPEKLPPLRQRRWHAGALTYTYPALISLFFWLLWGDFALNMKERSGPPTLQLLLKKFHASDLVLALLITSLPQAMALFITPVVSYHSDRLQTRWGRRIPFILATTPLAVLALLGLAYSPVLGRALASLLHIRSQDAAIITSFGIFWAIFELCTIVGAAVVLPGLINDVVPRELLGRFYGMFRAVSLGAGMLFNWYLLKSVEEHYVMLFILIAVLYAVSFTLMCLKVREPDYSQEISKEDIAVAEMHAAPATGELVATGATPAAGPSDAVPPTASRMGGFWAAVRTYFRECFGHSYYFWFFGSFALAAMAFTPINTFSIPFAQSIKMDMATYGKLSAIQLFVSLIQAYPIGWLCDRFHPLRITMLSLALYSISTLLAFFFVRTPFSFGIAHVVCGSCAGFWLTATAPLGPALLPRSRFAQFLSANHICTATGVLLFGAVVGWFLDLVHHQYHFIYFWACLLITSSLIVTFVLHRRFMEYGGPKGYVAPE